VFARSALTFGGFPRKRRTPAQRPSKPLFNPFKTPLVFSPKQTPKTPRADPEILERRYPVALHAFRLRAGSGGAGRWRGGDGVVRELEFLRPLAAGILSERRALAPFGLAGGGPGAKGLNLLVRAGSGRTVSLGGKATVAVAAGDRIIIHTPGAGGYGPPDAADGGGGRHGGKAKDGDGGRHGGRADAPAPEAMRGSVNEYRLRQEGA